MHAESAPINFGNGTNSLFYFQIAQPASRLRELAANATNTTNTTTTTISNTATTTAQKFEGFGAAFSGVANTGAASPVIPISTYNFWGS